MLKKVLGKGKKTNSPHEEEPIRKKRSTRSQAHGEGGSSQQQQPPPQPQEPQRELSYAEIFARDNPFRSSGHRSWSDRFYFEECKKRYVHISKFKMLQEKGFCEGLPEVPAINQQLRDRKWLKFNGLTEKGKYVGNPRMVREFYANAFHKKGAVSDCKVYVRGRLVDYNEDEINRLLGAVVPQQCMFSAIKDEIEHWNLDARNPVREFLGRPGTNWLKYYGGERPTKIRLGDFKPIARAWGEWVARNIIVLGNWSEYQLENAVLVKMIMEGEDINLGYLLQHDIKRMASNDAAVFTLGHCNLITALCRRSKVPEEEDDGELEPVKGLDYKYFHAKFSAGPVNNRGGNGGNEGHEEVGEEQDQGMQDVMEEIDRFGGGAVPAQEPQGSGSGWAYTHSEHELASLLHNLDLNTHFRMPNVYYQTQGALYTEAMSYRQQFPPPPFYPRFETPEAWNEYRQADLVEYQAIMDRNEAVFYEQYGAHTRAQEEQRAAASASAATPPHGSTFFTLGELGLDGSPGFQNFMDPPASG